jgi:hypothetical protein
MHSCVSNHVGFAGEFFVRTLRPHSPGDKSKHHERTLSGSSHKDTPRSVDDYELVIDNDSGTYRPPKEHLEDLQRFMDRALRGLRVRAVDAFDEEHIAMKKAHAEEKALRGRTKYKQPSGSRSSSESSFSSSDEEELQSGRLGVGRRIKRRVWNKVEGSGNGPINKIETRLGEDEQELQSGQMNLARRIKRKVSKANANGDAGTSEEPANGEGKRREEQSEGTVSAQEAQSSAPAAP